MSISEQYALIPLRDMVIYPGMITPVFLGRKKSVEAVEIADSTDRRIFFTLQKDLTVNEPGMADLNETGTIAKVLQVLKLPDGSIKILVEGLTRGRVEKFFDEPECLYAEVRPVIEREEYENTEAMTAGLMKAFNEYAELSGKVDPGVRENIKNMRDLETLTWMIAGSVHVKNETHQEILEINSLPERVEKVMETLFTEIELIRIDERIKKKVKTQMAKAQREYYLGEQIKAINKELGRDEDPKAEADEIESKIKESLMPDEVREKAMKELKKFRSMPAMSSETTVSRNYLDWLVSIPWGKTTEDNLDITRAEEILNRDHFGLEKPKERILEYLAVRSLSKKLKGPIICFAGPPGVGKTSLARSIAESMGRKFVRMSLGGMRDEAEIRGHRRTYVGALPGKIIQSIKKSGSMNPVFLLDEIDKLGSDYRGDPSSALLETLDPEQNSTFMDHYMEVEFDLSKVLFITTANSVESIPAPLLDRMEIIGLAGYTEKEKFSIAKNFLIPKQLEEHSLTAEQVKIADSAVSEIIKSYTREAGVRTLEREIASVIRKAARLIVQNKKKKTVKINAETVEKMLGKKKYRHEELREDEDKGIATGLAWTPYGGDILQIEVSVFPGSGKLELTGKLGEVMSESARTALSVVKSRADKFGIPAYMFKDNDIHLHVPEGAVPKDGPSAGITMTTALMSALSGLKVNCRIAMTGEITLRGRVLPVGGIKEKVLAAHRAGVKEIILPSANEKDLTDIPADVKNETRFHLFESIDQVLETVIIK
ncbi:endopeptidase La [Geovibrio ferrireducens]|uniref:endopeptidase La n=1 Tax=Geovibrio ferrireducens TaxID=46201 RepID=UPI0022461460|nr:endopeptidase La [Geovibrio ferrireducens]